LINTSKHTGLKNLFPILVFLIAVTLNCGKIPEKDKKSLQSSKQMQTIKQTRIDQLDGKDIFLFTLTSKNKMIVNLTNYGGIVTSIIVPDKNGRTEDVVLGFDSLSGYMETHPYFGCLVGRYANRIANGKFELDGVTYKLATNNGANHLHGGLSGFDKKIWDARHYYEGEDLCVELSCISPDGEEGYPGGLNVKVIYSLTNNNELKIRYFAESDRPTPVNLTYHGYFNLKGAGNGDILGHELSINADWYTVVNEQLIPTGELRDVAATPMDFRAFKTIGKDLGQLDGGYDHNFALNTTGEIIKAATLKDPSTGRWMEVYTDQPGLQFYGGNFLDGTLTGKNGIKYNQYYGLCLETQHFPDSPNQPGFPNTILRPGEQFKSTTIYKFGASE
jgi:aldose 1-epimerase